MSEQTIPASAADAFVETPGERVGRPTRLIGVISDFVILAGFTAFGAFVGLFIEDALVHLDVLAPVEGSKHGAYGMEFMFTGAAIGALFVTLQNFLGISANGQTLSGKLLRVQITDMEGNPTGIANAFFVRIGVPVIIIGGLIVAGQLWAALAVGLLILLVALVTGRCLHDIITGTQVVWSNQVDEIPSTIHLSEALRGFVDKFGRFGSWFIVPVVLITCFGRYCTQSGVDEL